MLKLKSESNRLYFDNDDDFYAFCVVPTIVLKDYTDINGNICQYADFDFSPQYNNAVNQGKTFIIKDEDSSIYKRGAVSFKTITKPVSNLGYYFKKPNKDKCELCQK